MPKSSQRHTVTVNQTFACKRSSNSDHNNNNSDLNDDMNRSIKKEQSYDSECKPHTNNNKNVRQSMKRRSDSDDERVDNKLFTSHTKQDSDNSHVKSDIKSKKKIKNSDYGREDGSKQESKSKKKKSIKSLDDIYEHKKEKKLNTKTDKSKKVNSKITNKANNKFHTKKNSKSQSSAVNSQKKKKEEDDEHTWKWWHEDRPQEGIKWKTLQHNGPILAVPYKPLPKTVKFYYDKKTLKLSEVAEEAAGFYAQMLGNHYLTKPIFNANFMKDWKKTMTDKERAVITDIKLCNFNEISDYYKEQSEKRKAMSKEEKKEIKRKNEEIQKEYGFCIIDGHKQKIGNFKIEPPGLFRGRGEHPKTGKLKKRVQPEDITINIGKKAEVPRPPDGHKWKEVCHDNAVSWLAKWTENIMGNVKYIMLNPSSKLKSIKDWQKYEKARELKKYVTKIRDDYRCDFKSREMVKRQRAVALYFIDKLALRAGNEKEEGETADTVGCCSLRVEHIALHDEKNGKQYVVDFDFLGKDSIRYENSVSVEKRVYKNLKLFMANKSVGDQLFDILNTASLNKYLNSLMKGLTAKVFRTYNASNTLQQKLDELIITGMTTPEKVSVYNSANRAVAELCNHQRTAPKTFDKQMENLNTKIDQKKAQIKSIKKEIKRAKRADSTNSAKLKKRLDILKNQLKKLEVQAIDKEKNKQIALGTSKLNYLDPRITVAWCLNANIPINQVFNKSQRDKFRWAIEMSDENFQF